MRHFTDIELYRWRESDPGEDRPRVVEHLAACAGCARRYAGAIRSRPLRAEPETNVGDFAAAGVRVPRRTPRWIVPIAAAILIAAIAIPLEMRRIERAPELHFRGAAIETFTPEGAVGRQVRFNWSSGLAASRFRIEIGQGDRVIYTAIVDRSPMDMPAQLQPGIAYWWTVTALEANGHPLLTSSRRTFTIRGER